MYADDIILLSPVDLHLQLLLDICNDYSQRWMIKFNALKSCIVEFGPQTFKISSFSIDNNKIPHTNSLKYLGVTIDNTLDFYKYSINKLNT